MAGKTWPGDAVMLICGYRGDSGPNGARPEQMESPVAVVCRDCYKPLYSDSHSIQRAAELPSRHNRPIDFFCVLCATSYDSRQLNELHDDRGWKKK